MPNNAQTTTQLYSFRKLSKNNAQNSPSQVSTVREPRMFKLGLEKAEEPEINCQYLLDHQKGEFQKKKSTFALLTTLKA